jgi:hypothetical protein
MGPRPQIDGNWVAMVCCIKMLTKAKKKKRCEMGMKAAGSQDIGRFFNGA